MQEQIQKPFFALMGVGAKNGIIAFCDLEQD